VARQGLGEWVETFITELFLERDEVARGGPSDLFEHESILRSRQNARQRRAY
jgi:hypothetical protein